MRRIVFQLDDNPDVKGEVGLDNEGNLYLRGAVGKGIRLLQDSNEGDYTPVVDNFSNITSIEMQNAGYVIMGKQVLVVLAFIKDVPDGESQSEFDVSLPFPPVLDAGTEAYAVFGITSAILDLVTGKVKMQALSNPFLAGSHPYQIGFIYRIKNEP